ncbi:hypothetical protein D9M71_594040 [compost metagenome]
MSIGLAVSSTPQANSETRSTSNLKRMYSAFRRSLSPSLAASLKAGRATAPNSFIRPVWIEPRISTAIEYTPNCAAVMLAPNQIRSPYMASTPTTDDTRIQRPKLTSSVSAERSHCRRLRGPCSATWPRTVLARDANTLAITSDQIERVK